MQIAYGDKKIFYKKFLFIIEKFDFLVEMPPEREVLWFFSITGPGNFFLDFPGY